jgi:hypothetical protein
VFLVIVVVALTVVEQTTVDVSEYLFDTLYVQFPVTFVTLVVILRDWTGWLFDVANFSIFDVLPPFPLFRSDVWNPHLFDVCFPYRVIRVDNL